MDNERRKFPHLGVPSYSLQYLWVKKCLNICHTAWQSKKNHSWHSITITATQGSIYWQLTDLLQGFIRVLFTTCICLRQATTSEVRPQLEEGDFFFPPAMGTTLWNPAVLLWPRHQRRKAASCQNRPAEEQQATARCGFEALSVVLRMDLGRRSRCKGGGWRGARVRERGAGAAPRAAGPGTRRSRAPSAGALVISHTSSDGKRPGRSWRFSSGKSLLFQKAKRSHLQLPGEGWNTEPSSLPSLPAQAAAGGPGSAARDGHPARGTVQVEKPQAMPRPLVLSLWHAASPAVSYRLAQHPAMPMAVLRTSYRQEQTAAGAERDVLPKLLNSTICSIYTAVANPLHVSHV